MLAGYVTNLGRVRLCEILTSKWVSTWAQRKAKGGGRVMPELRCLGAEPGSRKPPFPEEM